MKEVHLRVTLEHPVIKLWIHNQKARSINTFFLWSLLVVSWRRFICGVVCFLSPVECDLVCHHKIVETERPKLLYHLSVDCSSTRRTFIFFFCHRMGKRLREEFGNNVAFGLEGGYNLEASEGKDTPPGRKNIRKFIENSVEM